MNIGNILFKDIAKPARYVGGEVNQVIKGKKDIKCNVVLCYPNIYEKAMSDNNINMLYTNINEIAGVYCKRCFAPDGDFEKLLKDKNCNLYSLEDFESIKYSDILVFVLNSELEFTNYLNMLKLAGIDFKNQDSKRPKVILLATKRTNINAISMYKDIVFYEDEQLDNVKKVVKYLEEYSKSDFDKEYLSQDKELDFKDVKLNFPTSAIIPSIKIENSSIVIDLCYINKIEEILETVQNAIKKRGITQVSFVNYDKVTELKFCEIVYRLKMNVEGIRIGTKNIDFNYFSPNTLNVLIPCTEKSSLTFNVVTCSDKIISRLNIGQTKEQLFERIRSVFKNNRSSIKLEFSIGLPNETFEDIDNMFEVVQEIVDIYSQSKAKDKFSITVCVSIYIPTMEEMKEYNVGNMNKLDTKLRYIKEKNSDPVVKWKVENTDRYAMKLLLKNGGEEVSKVLERAYELGARFDDDERKYQKAAWDKAIFENNEIAKKYMNNH